MIDYVKGRRVKVSMCECCGLLDFTDFDEMYGAGRGRMIIDFLEDADLKAAGLDFLSRETVQ